MPDLLLDKYHIEKTLGQGAFGEVYLVTHRVLGVARAVKVLKRDTPGLGSRDYSEAQARFQLEAQLGARLNTPLAHPHLLQVFDCILSEEISLLEMEYAAGGSLAARLQAERDASQLMPIEAALQIALEVAGGLAALHAKDMIHRDLKPANILFDEQGHARLADLGLAQVPGGPSLRSQLSEPQPHPGTPGYMSPEQESSGKPLKPPSDVYALGLVLFEMLTGKFYYNLRPGTRAASLRAELPASVDDLLARMLAENYRERVWDGAEAAGLLRAALGANSASARQVAEEARLRKEQELAAQARQAAEEVRLRKEPELAAQARQAAEEARLRKEQELAERTRIKAEEEEKRRKGLIVELAPGVTMEFVRVPAGPFLMGSDPRKDKQAQSDEQPQHTVTLDEYLIGKYPVTNRQYLAFVQAAGRKAPGHWKSNTIPAGKENHPVVNVNWQAAADFCMWAAKVSGARLRLPSEAEWEKAARGTDGRIYPWGSEAPDKWRCNFGNYKNDTTPVGQYSPQGDSPYDCVDMAGNVCEWAADWFGAYGSPLVSNPIGPASGTHRVLRGGSWNLSDYSVRSAYRRVVEPSFVYYYENGFRCARSI